MSDSKKKLKETQPLRKTAEFLADFLTDESGTPIEIGGGVIVDIAETVDEEHGGTSRKWVAVSHQGAKGFVDETFLAPVSAEIDIIPGFQAFDTEVSRETFAGACFTQALLAKTNAAYLYALAFAESGESWTAETVKAPEGSATEAAGIYRYPQSTWDTLIKALTSGSPGSQDRKFPVAQCIVSAAFAGKAQESLQKALGEHPVDGIALYLAHIFARDVKFGVKASKAVLDAEKANAGSALADVLGTIFGSDQAAIDGLKLTRPALFAGPSVGDFVKACAKQLDAGYKEAGKIGHEISEQVPDKPEAPVFTGKFDGPIINVTEDDVKALAAVAQSEVAIFKSFGDAELKGGVTAVIDTIFNRVVYPSKEFAKSIQAEIERPFQFSALNGIGDWTKLPAPNAEILGITRAHVEGRANGLASKIRGATHFFNPKKSNPAWGRYLLDNKIAVYGKESSQHVHYHGFASKQYKPPKAYAISFQGKLHPFRGDGTGLPGTQKIPPISTSPPQPGATLPNSWKPAANMKRIVAHWTAGGHKASGLDKSHYHILIEADGNLVLGKFSIKANEKPVSGGYAAHTRKTNSGAIGISVCCMRNATESPFNAGPSPMTKVQWDVMISAMADLCRSYSIEVTPQTVLGHGEVEKNLGPKHKQTGKWDPLRLPWDPSKSIEEVGNLMRASVKALL